MSATPPGGNDGHSDRAGRGTVAGGDGAPAGAGRAPAAADLVVRCADLVVRHAGELVTCGGDALGIISDGAVAVAAGRVVWVGPDADLQRAVTVGDGARVLDAGGRVVMPGVVECHTHVVFGGDRAAEFQMRVAGRSYAEIAAAGGGIKSTVRATRAHRATSCFAVGRQRLQRLLRYGVTTVEVKSGYGLTVADELRLLEVYRDLAA